MKQKPNVYLIATGGTIAGRADSASATVGYRAGELAAGQLISSVPGLDKMVNVTGEQLCNIDSKDMQESIWLQLARRVEEVAARNDVDGVVITHGTDTMEETAYFLQLALKTEKPVVLTGAMRPATAISADGPMNLWQAVLVAAEPDAGRRGVLVVMNGQIDGAERVTKTSTDAVQTFQSPASGPVGIITGGRIFWQDYGIMYAPHENKHNELARELRIRGNAACASSKNKLCFGTENLTQLPCVKIIYGYVGGDDDLFVKAALQDGVKGLVYAACGNGSVPARLKGALKDAVASGVPVVIASRCGGGIVMLPDEITEKDIFIASGLLNPQKAKILLQMALTKTNDLKEIQEIFKTNRC